ncbi:MAG: hypothetical protein ACI9QL_001134 [Candidatus Omnitrophota bacterium]|jgi:hypothetical protein
MKKYLLILLLAPLCSADEGTSLGSFHGYDACIALSNQTTRVVLCPAVGGRVLEYALDGVHALPLPEGGRGGPAGRFDIGPELIIPKRPLLWSGVWTGEIIGPRQARLTSQPDPSTGVQLIREFELASSGSRLSCKQIIVNVSDHPVEYAHWSRTFAQGKGIVLIPLSAPSRFPNKYVMYERNGHAIEFKPEDPMIREREGFLEILGAPKNPKLGFDSATGWFAYLSPNNLMFLKSYEVDPERVYNELAGLTISIWYPDHLSVVELEPIGPREKILPAGRAWFTETWHLAPFDFPGKQDTDLPRVRATAEALLK